MGILVLYIRKNENKRKGFNFLLHFHSYIFFIKRIIVYLGFDVQGLRNLWDVN